MKPYTPLVIAATRNIADDPTRVVALDHDLAALGLATTTAP